MVWNTIDVRYAEKKSKKQQNNPRAIKKNNYTPMKTKMPLENPRVQMVDFPSSRFHTWIFQFFQKIRESLRQSWDDFQSTTMAAVDPVKNMETLKGKCWSWEKISKHLCQE